MGNRDIAIIGGGPVGLYLAIRLLQSGISCRVYEQKPKPDSHSKSLGIHPLSLDLFSKAGIVEPFLNAGIRIDRGIALWNRELLGHVTFERCPPPHRFILAIPQFRTEEILEEQLRKMDPDAVCRGAVLEEFTDEGDSVRFRISHNGRSAEQRARFLIGCDGKNGVVRESAGIRFEGGAYPDTYMMGDFTDTTGYNRDAVIWLHKSGLVESFPLPGSMRRWVVKTENYHSEPDRFFLEAAIRDRTGHDLSSTDNVMMSSFGVQHLLADRFAEGRIALAGDAAHVVSPIGGQGMNLGWLDAEALAEALSNSLNRNRDHAEEIRIYNTVQRRIARQTARRAELNMLLGRKESTGPLWQMLAKGMIRTPIRHLLAKAFTMRGLDRWPL